MVLEDGARQLRLAEEDLLEAILAWEKSQLLTVLTVCFELNLERLLAFLLGAFIGVHAARNNRHNQLVVLLLDAILLEESGHLSRVPDVESLKDFRSELRLWIRLALLLVVVGLHLNRNLLVEVLSLWIHHWLLILWVRVIRRLIIGVALVH